MNSFVLSFVLFLLGNITMLSSNNQIFAEASRFSSIHGYFGGGKRKDKIKKLTVKVVNLSYLQPFSAFFVMVHNSRPPPLFEFGEAATDALAFLAETGSPEQLVDLYDGMSGVFSVSGFAGDGRGDPFPLGGGNTTYIDVEYDRRHRFVTIASMFINSNDGIVAVNGMRLSRGRTLYLDGLDAGSERNTEVCSDIPGPACTDVDTRNERSTMRAEGFVHVHRGIDGFADLSSAAYDWRNPMAKVSLI